MVSPALVERAAALKMSTDQLEVLDHLGTFRITTSEAVGQLLDAKPEAVKSFLQRLHAAGYIDSADLYGRTKYHFLTAVGLRLVGLPDRLPQPEPVGGGLRDLEVLPRRPEVSPEAADRRVPRAVPDARAARHARVELLLRQRR